MKNTTDMVSFKLFAGTNIGLRENNEDNFTVCPDLIKNEWIVPADYQQVIPLGSYGCVMVVADGMGGQNAGEVASAIAIKTVQDMFAPAHLPADVLDKPDAIKSFLKKVISECDIRIKRTTKADPSTNGMGSTLVMAWLIGNKLYIAWIGDSRAYSFIKGKGIARLSKDHSYVQQLVDAEAISEEEAMTHPNSNIITRSLGDTSQKAKADVIEYDIEDGQVILLCTDGLCGVCRDEIIGGIIEEEENDLQKCKEKLTTAALAAGGSDNITISLMQIKTSSAVPTGKDVCNGILSKIKNLKRSTLLISLLGICVLFALLFVGLSSTKGKETPIKKSVKIWLDKNTLESKDKTKYHIRVIGDSVSTLIYDKSLIIINTKDSTILVKKNSLKNDTIVYLKVICKDSSLVDSTDILIKQKKSGGVVNNVKTLLDKRTDNNTPPKDTAHTNNKGNSGTKITLASGGSQGRTTKIKNNEQK